MSGIQKMGNRGTDIENKGMDIKVGKQWWDDLPDQDWHIYTIDTKYKTDDKNLLCSTGNSTQCSVVT